MTTEELFRRLHELFEYRDGDLIRRITITYNSKAGDIAGCQAGNGYKKVNIDGEKHYIHRCIFLMHHGHLPKIIDHRDRDTYNNRIENLREATNSQNLCNSAARNKSGLKGCYYSERAKRWSANIKACGKTMHLGSFGTSEEAFAAYCAASKKYQGEFAPDLDTEA